MLFHFTELPHALEMESFIRVQRRETDDVVIIPILLNIDGQLVSVNYLGQRFGLDPKVIKSVCQGTTLCIHLLPLSQEKLRESCTGIWEVGAIYFLNSTQIAENVLEVEKDTDVEIVDLASSDDSLEQILLVSGKLNPIYCIFASDIPWKLKGSREISKCVSRFLVSRGEVEVLECLPKNYNGE